MSSDDDITRAWRRRRLMAKGLEAAASVPTTSEPVPGTVTVAGGATISAATISAAKITWSTGTHATAASGWSISAEPKTRCPLCDAREDLADGRDEGGVLVCYFCWHTMLPYVRDWHGIDANEEVTVVDAWEWASVFQFGEGAEVVVERAAAIEFLRRRIGT